MSGFGELLGDVEKAQVGLGALSQQWWLSCPTPHRFSLLSETHNLLRILRQAILCLHQAVIFCGSFRVLSTNFPARMKTCTSKTQSWDICFLPTPAQEESAGEMRSLLTSIYRVGRRSSEAGTQI